MSSCAAVELVWIRCRVQTGRFPIASRLPPPRPSGSRPCVSLLGPSAESPHTAPGHWRKRNDKYTKFQP